MIDKMMNEENKTGLYSQEVKASNNESIGTALIAVVITLLSYVATYFHLL